MPELQGLFVRLPGRVDMAQYKSEILHRTYRGKLRPLSHYSLGWLPTWGRLLTAIPGVSTVANAALGFRPLAKLVLSGGGMDPRRKMVRFNDRRFSRWAKSRISPAEARNASTADRDALVADEYVSTSSAGNKQVLLWADSFTEYLSDAGARTAVDLLESAGFEILLPEQQTCCGLTLISTGQLDAAKRKLESTMAILDPYARKNIPIVGIEPSCTAVLRSDLGGLFPDDERARRIAATTSTLAEVLIDAELDVPDLTGRTVVVQPHCHQHSVMASPRTGRSSNARERRFASSRAAAVWPGTSAWRPATTRLRWRWPRTLCCRLCATPRRIRSSWPTGSPAGHRRRTSRT